MTPPRREQLGRSFRGRRGRLLAIGLALAAVALTGAPAVYSAFVATAPTTGNSISSGTVQIADNDSGTALLSLSNAVPGDSDTGCIKVTYGGSLTAGLRLHGTTTGTGLDPYLTLTVTRGTYTSDPGFDSCTNFQPDAADYIGAGQGVVYDGTLQGFADDYATGLVDPEPATPESWTNGESHVYRLRIALGSDSAGQGKDATQTFVWEARNE